MTYPPHGAICAVTTSLKPYPSLTSAKADSRRLLRSALLVLAMLHPLENDLNLAE